MNGEFFFQSSRVFSTVLVTVFFVNAHADTKVATPPGNGLLRALLNRASCSDSSGSEKRFFGSFIVPSSSSIGSETSSGSEKLSSLSSGDSQGFKSDGSANRPGSGSPVFVSNEVGRNVSATECIEALPVDKRRMTYEIYVMIDVIREHYGDASHVSFEDVKRVFTAIENRTDDAGGNQYLNDDWYVYRMLSCMVDEELKGLRNSLLEALLSCQHIEKTVRFVLRGTIAKAKGSFGGIAKPTVFERAERLANLPSSSCEELVAVLAESLCVWADCWSVWFQRASYREALTPNINEMKQGKRSISLSEREEACKSCNEKYENAVKEYTSITKYGPFCFYKKDSLVKVCESVGRYARGLGIALTTPDAFLES